MVRRRGSEQGAFCQNARTTIDGSSYSFSFLLHVHVPVCLSFVLLFIITTTTRTPLHCAASCNNLAMVKFLVEHGACIFAATLSDQETAAEKCEEDEEGFDGCSEYLYSKIICNFDAL